MANAAERFLCRRSRLLNPHWLVPNGGKRFGEDYASKWSPRSKLFVQFSSSEGAPLNGGKRGIIEQLWRELFSDPSEWRDHRPDKGNPRFPDFKHKRTHKALWLNSEWVPPWVEPKLAAMPPRTFESSTFAWNQRLSKYVAAGQYEKAVDLFQQMQRNGMTADRFTFFPVLKAIASLGLLEHGRRIHVQISELDFEADLFIGSSLVDMYAKCGSLEEAERVFNHMPTRNVVAWTAMIVGYVKCGEGQKSLELFEEMQRQGVAPNPVTFVGVLNTCASMGALDQGRCAHGEIIRRGYESSIMVGSSLVDMYAKCGSIEEAERMFKKMPTRNVVTWTAMIVGYVKCGGGQQALKLYRQMQQERVDPDPLTFVGVLNACASITALEEGRQIHEEIIQRGYESDSFVGSCLVDMYAKCGRIEEAERVFNQMLVRNVVAWTAMIVGYVKCGVGQKALQLFEKMQRLGVDPNSVTYVGVLNACASITALEEGRLAHAEIIQRGYESDIFVGSSLVDMYAKCGSIEEAERVFNQMPTKNAVAWTAMIEGYASHGHVKEALETFKQMCGTVKVDGATFISILSACSHRGFVDEGLELFKSMSAVHNVTPTLQHYACAVDLLGRAGRVREAEDLIRSMPVEPNTTVWISLLGACRVHGNVEIGERGAKKILELDPNNSAAYVLLSDIYAAAGKCDRNSRVLQ